LLSFIKGFKLAFVVESMILIYKDW
jgi:hypothetical protein